MIPSIVLFDIDGTLISSGGVGRKAVNAAFNALYQRNDACNDFRFDGMTDFAIFRKGLSAIGISPTTERMTALIEVYLKHLEADLSQRKQDGYRALPGVERAVEAAHARGMAVGLGTGNVKDGARIKLNHVGLFQHFAFGGFGCDHESRSELIRIGAERGAAALGVSMAECRIVIVGDTPHDVSAARHIQAECIGVGTGAFSPNDLMEAGATYAFSSLEEPGAFNAICGV